VSAESFQEQFARVLSMSEDDGETWDLSDNDKAALKAVLLRLVQRDGDAADLLAACKKVVEHYGDPAGGDLFGLRAAIAKAESGQ
jgi:hypothetical protein